jgi:hypothetical protein
VTKHLTGGLNPIIFFIAGPAIKKDAMTSLHNLKQMVESKPAS